MQDFYYMNELYSYIYSKEVISRQIMSKRSIVQRSIVQQVLVQQVLKTWITVQHSPKKNPPQVVPRALYLPRVYILGTYHGTIPWNNHI